MKEPSAKDSQQILTVSQLTTKTTQKKEKDREEQQSRLPAITTVPLINATSPMALKGH